MLNTVRIEDNRLRTRETLLKLEIGLFVYEFSMNFARVLSEVQKRIWSEQEFVY